MDPALARLATERAETVARLAALNGDYASVVEASRDDNADDEHDPEGATIAFERSQIGALVLQVERQLVEIDAAVARIGAGTYGECERCGRAIDTGRLEVRPTARTCVPCAALS